MLIDQLAELRDIVLRPEMDLARATERLGPIATWIGDLAILRPAPPLTDAVIERFRGTLAGVQLRFKETVLSWNRVEESFGRGQEGCAAWDDWGGPVPYRFVSATAAFPRAYVLLSLHGRDGDAARIDSMIVRRRLARMPEVGP